MYVSAIVLAAGRGLRFSRPNIFTARCGIPTQMSEIIGSGRSKIPKPLFKINQKPIIIYSLNILSRHPLIKDIIVVVNTLNSKDIVDKIRQYKIKKVRKIVLGGKERQDSVQNGLRVLDIRTDLVLIHDAVRPFIDKGMVSSVIIEAKKSDAAIVGVPVKATIKSVKCQVSSVKEKFVVEKTLDRNNLWEIQTPQVFKKELILKAYNKFGNIPVTDDASLIEKLGMKVSIVMGSHSNIKITTPEDLVLAEAIAKTL